MMEAEIEAKKARIVSVKAKIEGTKMTGTVNSPEGEMKITAEKQK